MGTDIIRTRLEAGLTHLAVGPTSPNVVDAVITTANATGEPILLIASRRQIECSEYGGGYVNGWSTEAFASFVKYRDTRRLVKLCRDHGGPRQHPSELHLSETEAIESAKFCIERDISAGFEFIHLDLSALPSNMTMSVLVDMCAHVQEQARECGRIVDIELGIESQSGRTGNPEDLRNTLKAVESACCVGRVKFPLFVVAQTGTRVEGVQNEGEWAVCSERAAQLELLHRTRELTGLVREYGAFTKEHNGDYLPAQALRARSMAGIGGINIAPELGVLETRCIIDICRAVGCSKELDEFLELAFRSGKWHKWFERTEQASDMVKAIAAGHYVFGTPEFKDIYDRIDREAAIRGLDVKDMIGIRLCGRLNEIIGYLASPGSLGLPGMRLRPPQ